MRAVICIVILAWICSCFHAAEGVQCYQCAYIEGVKELNRDCLDNIRSGTVKTGAGLACLKAEGTTREGKSFIIRRSFRPAFSSIGPSSVFPSGQKELSCESAAKYGNSQVTSAALSVKIIGDMAVQELTSCVLCNDQEDGCNGASAFNFNLFSFIFLVFCPLLLSLQWK